MGSRKDISKDEIKQKLLIAEYELCIYLDCSPAHLQRMRADDPEFAACWKARRKISRPAVDDWLTKPGVVDFSNDRPEDISEMAAAFESKL